MRGPERSRRVFCALTVVSFASAVAFTPHARADEGGVPFWLSGQYASLAAFIGHVNYLSWRQSITDTKSR